MNLRLLIASSLVIFGMIACASVDQVTDRILTEIDPTTTIEPKTGQSLESELIGRLDVDSNQAMGGLGIIFAFAQQRMTPEEFMQLSGSVPNMDQYLAAVPKLSSDFQVGVAANTVDETTLGADGLNLLDTSFHTLGMEPELVVQFESVILQYLQDRSDLIGMSLLQNALH